MSTLLSSEPVTLPKRRWARYHCDVPVRLIFGNGKRQRTVEGRGTELNEGGLGMYAGIELEVGDQVEVEIAVPFHTAAMRIPAIVRDRPSNGYYYGIEFLDTSPKQKGEIAMLSKMLQSAAGHLDS